MDYARKSSVFFFSLPDCLRIPSCMLRVAQRLGSWAGAGGRTNVQLIEFNITVVYKRGRNAAYHPPRPVFTSFFVLQVDPLPILVPTKTELPSKFNCICIDSPIALTFLSRLFEFILST